MSGAGVVHYHLLHRSRSVPTALGPAPLATAYFTRNILFLYIFKSIWFKNIFLNIFKSIVISDVRPTDRWLNVWCIWLTNSGNTSGVSKSHRIYSIIRDFWETCVVFFNVLPRNKEGMTSNPWSIYNDWIAPCVLICRHAVKTPEVFDPPSYYSLSAESTIDSHANRWFKITRFEANQSHGIHFCYMYVNS